MSTLDCFTDRFGSRFERIDLGALLLLRIALSQYSFGLQSGDSEYSLLHNAVEECPSVFEADDRGDASERAVKDLIDAIEILEGLSLQDAESLLAAITAKLKPL